MYRPTHPAPSCLASSRTLPSRLVLFRPVQCGSTMPASSPFIAQLRLSTTCYIPSQQGAQRLIPSFDLIHFSRRIDPPRAICFCVSSLSHVPSCIAPANPIPSSPSLNASPVRTPDPSLCSKLARDLPAPLRPGTLFLIVYLLQQVQEGFFLSKLY